MSTFEKVRDAAADVLAINPEEITMDSDFRTDLGADSLDFPELFNTFEDIFGNKIPDDIAADIKTVRDVVNYVDENFTKND